ncbi:MAG: SpoIIE family protein phosphatase [Verrucomicrobiota bacterium]
MRSIAPVSLRIRLTLLVLLAGVPALALTFYTAIEQRRLAAIAVQQDALRVARLASAGQERLIEGTHQILLLLAQLTQVRGDDAAACNALLLDLLKQYPLYSNVGVIATNGTVFASAVKLPQSVNLSDRTYFRRALESRAFAMGDYQIGRITGKASINFGLPVLDADTNVQRVVFAALDLAWLNEYTARASLPSDARVTVIDRNGIVLVRYPDGENLVGKQATEMSIVRTMIERGVEGTARAPGLDGHPTLFAFTPLSSAAGSGLVYISIGIPEEVAYAAVNRMTTRNVAWLGIVGVLALLAAWFGSDIFILRRIRALVTATQRLAGGDLQARTGLTYGTSEFSQLARAFDDMAATLEIRTNERQRAQQELKALNEVLEQRVADRTSELRTKNEQMEADLRMAREIQVAILPQAYPTFPKTATPEQSALRFSHHYNPTETLGGDFFTVLALSDTEAGVFICDVMGHGVRSALVTTMLRAMVEELAPEAHDPGKLLTRINRDLSAILKQTGAPIFATAFYFVADVARGEMRYAKAGHPNPLHFLRATGMVEPVRCASGGPGPALGMFAQTIYQTHCEPLGVGDRVLLFTDGAFEVVGADNQDFDQKQLLALARQNAHCAPDQLIRTLLTEIQRFSGTTTFADDVCFVGMEVSWIGDRSTVNGGGLQ